MYELGSAFFLLCQLAIQDPRAALGLELGRHWCTTWGLGYLFLKLTRADPECTTSIL